MDERLSNQSPSPRVRSRSLRRPVRLPRVGKLSAGATQPGLGFAGRRGLCAAFSAAAVRGAGFLQSFSMQKPCPVLGPYVGGIWPESQVFPTAEHTVLSGPVERHLLTTRFVFKPGRCRKPGPSLCCSEDGAGPVCAGVGAGTEPGPCPAPPASGEGLTPLMSPNGTCALTARPRSCVSQPAERGGELTSPVPATPRAVGLCSAQMCQRHSSPNGLVRRRHGVSNFT